MSTASLPPPATSTALIRLNFDSAGLRMSSREFDDIADFEEGYRYELVDGVVVVSPVPGDAHADPNDLLGYLLNNYRYTHASGSVLSKTVAERHIRVKNGRRIGDRLVWVGFGRRPVSSFDTPTIAIEFVSSGKRNRERDYETKRDEFLEAGVREYWVFDRFDRTMTVYSASDSGLRKVVLREDETFQTELLPGFELPVKRILDEAAAAAEAQAQCEEDEQ